MATFLALSPPLGSHQSRQAPDLFSIELELLLPDDHFLPAQNIVAQVWTNLIHRLNPDGPETWAAVPMKLSHVSSVSASTLEGGKDDNSNKRRSVAVFATRIQPTGRGDFALTARWKAHTDLTEWQWAPTAVDPSPEDEQQRQPTKDGELIKNKDVGITVRVPRSISGTSSWTMGPQSVLVYGQHGPRLDGLLAAPTASASISPSALAAATTTGSAMAMIGGPGLYLGNHAAATRARISGYEAVLSLVGDLLDFDERIPESDKDVNKTAWLEQAKAKEEGLTPPKRFSVLSRSSSISLSAAANETLEGDGSQQGSLEGLTRRTSVSDFMARYEPGMTNGLEEEQFLAGVVNEPEEGPRLTRKTSVTEMMVQIPVSSSPPVSKRLSRASYSVGSITSIAEQDGTAKAAEATLAPAVDATTPTASGAVPQKETLHAKASSVSGSNGNGVAKANPIMSNPTPTSGKKGSKGTVANTDTSVATTTTATTTATATTAASLPPPTAAVATSTPPLSKKEKAKAAAAAAATAATAAPAPTNAAALPPVSSSKLTSSSSSTSGRCSTSVALSSPTIASLGIGRAFPSVESTGLSTPSSSKGNTDNELESAAASKDGKAKDTPPTSINTSNASNGLANSSPPPSSANVMSTLTSSFSSSAMISSLAADSKGTSSSADTCKTGAASRPFSHKVISLPPGAHNKISDAALKEAVTFLMDEISQGKKVLVHCRDGHGRSGSVAIAYIVAREQLQQRQDNRTPAILRSPAETYEAALNEAWRWKCDVYPHKGLRQSLERIEWESKA